MQKETEGQSEEILKHQTHQNALELLVDGNKRFVENRNIFRDNLQQISRTYKAQYPFAVIHGCIDSRVAAEIIFDQGIGDVFNIRVAGNVINNDVLGSMEFACKVIGSKLIVVIGHSQCGAVQAACDGVELGNLNYILDKIKPAITKVNPKQLKFDTKLIDKVAKTNVGISIDHIRNKSKILRDLEAADKIKIVGAFYDVKTGKVEFL